jgi:hypothetical protein
MSETGQGIVRNDQEDTLIPNSECANAWGMLNRDTLNHPASLTKVTIILHRSCPGQLPVVQAYGCSHGDKSRGVQSGSRA